LVFPQAGPDGSTKQFVQTLITTLQLQVMKQKTTQPDDDLEYNPIIEAVDEPPIEYCNLDKRLNRRQHLFIWHSVNNPRMSFVDAATKSGYKDPRQAANKLMMNSLVRSEYNYLMNEVKKKYELNYDRAVQDLYDIRDKALEHGSFNAAITAQNSLLKMGGLIVDRKEVKYGLVDQMSREEVEKRLKQLLGQTVNAEITDESVDSVGVVPVLGKIDDNKQKDTKIKH
jgi:hypothetical protein|tara:strand:+ start:16 stop:696 length:681 start_codon:yes stop_codon:yes gene_type:complete